MKDKRTGRLRPSSSAWLATVAVAMGLSCGGGGPTLQTFGNQYSRAVCRRVFECCAPGDEPFAIGVGTTAPDEATCVTMTENTFQGETAQVVASGLIRYDAAAAQRCLADLQQPCPDVFSPKTGQIQPCADVFPGALPVGAACEDLDFACASHDCQGVCVARPPGCEALSCPADQFCRDPAAGCQPRVGLGASCTGAECADGLTCDSTVTCTLPLPDGQPCTSPWDCANTCSTTTAGNSPPGVCRLGFCQGT